MKFFYGIIVSLFLIFVRDGRVFGLLSSSYKSYANALSVIMEKFYIKNNLEVEFLLADNDSKQFGGEVINEVMKINQQIKPIVVKHIPDLEIYKSSYS